MAHKASYSVHSVNSVSPHNNAVCSLHPRILDILTSLGEWSASPFGRFDPCHTDSGTLKEERRKETCFAAPWYRTPERPFGEPITALRYHGSLNRGLWGVVRVVNVCGSVCAVVTPTVPLIYFSNLTVWLVGWEVYKSKT